MEFADFVNIKDQIDIHEIGSFGIFFGGGGALCLEKEGGPLGNSKRGLFKNQIFGHDSD